MGPRLAGAAALAAAVFLSRSSDAGWDGSQDVKLGDQVVAEFRGAPLVEVHDYTFWAPTGTVLTAQCVVDKSTPSLVPDMNLFTDLDAAVPLGAAQVGNKVTNYAFTSSGEYYLKLRATAGTGIYKLTTKAKFPKLAKGSETTGSFRFDAVAGTTMAVTVKPTKGSTATPNITGLTFPGGVVDITSPPAKRFLKAATFVTKLAKIPLPVNGTYTLAIDPGTAGQSVDVLVTLAPPTKFRAWAPGVVEDPVGMPSAQRTEWMASPHADHTAAAFNDWNTTNPPAVPGACSRCHTTTGYESYVGQTGAAYATPADQPIGQVITCDACHNEAAGELTSVKFPSGQTVSGLGKEARCMMCHQGRESTASVEAKIKSAAPGTVDDAMSVGGTAVSFINVHYLAAGATLYGHEAQGGYEYPDPAKTNIDLTVKPASGQPAAYYPDPVTGLSPRLAYESKFTHVKGPFPSADMDTCVGCHDPHSTELRISDRCAVCHVNAAGQAVATKNDLHDIRMAGTTADFDGDGVKKGVYYEIAGMRAVLLTAIQDYASAQFNKKIAYNADAYPYFFLDTNGDGVADATEAVSANKYPNWSARLLKAAYNYQYSVKDPGAYAHNAKYVIELLYDSAQDLQASGKLQASTSAAIAKLVRNDSGHFDGAAEPFRHWDELAVAWDSSTPPKPVPQGTTTGTDQNVDAACSRCHSPNDGFKWVLDNSFINAQSPHATSDGFGCESCHVEGADFGPTNINTTPDQFGAKKPNRRYVAQVIFPYQEFSLPTTGTASTVIPSTQAQISAVTIYNGAQGTNAQDDSFICMTCHRARESTLTINAAIAADAGLGAKFTLGFKNSHYLGAGATMYGSKAGVMYQYTGKTYAQRWDHDQGYTQPYALNAGVPVTAATKAQCTFCHMDGGDHTFEVKVGPGTACINCHTATSVDLLTPYARAEDNYDNDPTTKPKAELAVFQARLLTAIMNYCKTATDAGGVSATYVTYDGSTNPYWFVDTNKDGVRQATETTGAKFDAKGLRAAFNYNFSVKEPGSWAHNPKFVLQELYDSIQDLGGDLTNLTRPN
jgi:hypothetical protein